MEPKNAAKLFAWFWASKNINVPADRKDWTEVRRLVQGGSDGLPRLISICTTLLSLA